MAETIGTKLVIREETKREVILPRGLQALILSDAHLGVLTAHPDSPFWRSYGADDGLFYFFEKDDGARGTHLIWPAKPVYSSCCPIMHVPGLLRYYPRTDRARERALAHDIPSRFRVDWMNVGRDADVYVFLSLGFAPDTDMDDKRYARNIMIYPFGRTSPCASEQTGVSFISYADLRSGAERCLDIYLDELSQKSAQETRRV